MPFLLLLFPAIEIFLFYKFSQIYSFWDAVLWVILVAFLGILIIKLQGKSTLLLLQKDLAQGKIPATQVMHRSFVILGGILLVIPGFLTDLMGLAAILPGTRHLMVAYLKNMISKGLLRGRVFTSGFGFQTPDGGFQFRHMGGFPPPHGRRNEERDAQVVDIEPIEITHTKKPDQ